MQAHKLILVEGLTGSGKSIMAHFIARQLQYSGMAANWVHEGEEPHPYLIDVEGSIEDYMAQTRTNWKAFVERTGASDEVCVIEASFFNNLCERLMYHQVERGEILRYAAELERLGDRLNPALVYLVQADVAQALERNFGRRGEGFRDFVIQISTSTPLAQAQGWTGYGGMQQFWQTFVGLTDDLYSRFPGRKLKIDNTAEDWERYNQQVVDFLSIPLVADAAIDASEAQRLVGRYHDRESERVFEVQYENGELRINLFLEVWTRLVRRTANEYWAEGWPFELRFERDEMKGTWLLKFGARNVDYLPLAGICAEKEAVERGQVTEH